MPSRGLDVQESEAEALLSHQPRPEGEPSDVHELKEHDVTGRFGYCM